MCLQFTLSPQRSEATVLPSEPERGLPTMSEGSSATSQKSTLKRLAPLIVLVAVIAFVLAMEWHRYLTLEHIAHNRASL